MLLVLKGPCFEKKGSNALKTEKCNRYIMLRRAVSESGVSMPELMDQQCRLVPSLQHQTECPYRYFRWMTYGIFGKNRKFENFLIFVETSPITIYERFCSDKNAYHWL